MVTLAPPSLWGNPRPTLPANSHENVPVATNLDGAGIERQHPSHVDCSPLEVRMGIWAWWKAGRPGTPQPIHPSVNEQLHALCQVLQALIAVLENDGETHWRDWMVTSLTSLEANDLRGARHLRGAYGGMGSFNDLVIGQRMDGEVFTWTPDAKPANDQLDALRKRAYVLVEEILNGAPSPLGQSEDFVGDRIV